MLVKIAILSHGLIHNKKVLLSRKNSIHLCSMKEILLYKTDNAEVKVEILLQNENLWLTQAKMAELFDVQKAAISKHLKNIFADGELDEKVVVSKMETTTNKHYFKASMVATFSSDTPIDRRYSAILASRASFFLRS